MLPDNRLVEISCPAKINLSLAVLGKRADGFHALQSIVAQTAFGDDLSLAWKREGAPSADRVEVIGMDALGEDNTVSRAIRLFRSACKIDSGVLTAKLRKRIPSGAGLGGGSSDGVATLKALREIFPEASRPVDLASLAAEIGSDCPLFLKERPVLMEGRGELISELEESLCARFRGKPVVLFKPPFRIDTVEAYRRLAAGGYYTSAESAAALLEQWRTGSAQLPPRGNDFERLVGDWFPSLFTVLKRFQVKFQLDARMSGSGSAGFVFPRNEESDTSLIRRELQASWGSAHWMVSTVIK